MVVGFNHNFRYKGAVFHVQTEDGGVKSPQIVTLLYHGGSILSSKKTSYADLCQKENLAALVEELMKEQHRDMLRRLKDGEFDEIIDRLLSGSAGDPAPSRPSLPKEAPKKTAVAPRGPVAAPAEPDAPEPAPAAEAPKPKPEAAAASLDDIILSYLIGEDK